ncbi:hypothetical protein ALQ78_101304 [Pseudomonas syringae pv. aptata]|nr:Unknown protein sequence [Pseudomonas syringae pv. syringae]KPY28458.1 hypothetical protein ALO65_101805 [Pseudomonas syringae pv. papulans]RMM47502.1 hypothetical protein ALQ78_101304 [Pseudomonas syringae pv. aptata]RMS22178.1 hypothetical protein ALP69_101737 [Pseudomonas syringae pv. aceris]RMS59750.1 hypothetical protein ALP63_102117 [Pseudomonas syringae pv. aceris]
MEFAGTDSLSVGQSLIKQPAGQVFRPHFKGFTVFAVQKSFNCVAEPASRP